MTYKIEKSIPLPSVRLGAKEYPFSEMDVGDSFLIKGGARDIERARSAASYFGRCNNHKFAIRCTDPLTKSYRCWRIA